MRTPITIAAIMAFTTILTSGCWTGDEKVKQAEESLTKAKVDAQAEADKKAIEDAWNIYKADAEVRIEKNDARIADLKNPPKKPGKIQAKIDAAKIEDLQKRNADLRARIVTYNLEHSEWESFKREFEHDMEALGKAFEDLAVNNKK